MTQNHNSKGWTFNSYDTYVSRRFEDNSKAVDAALAAAKEAVTKAEKTTGERLSSLNELRGIVTDQQQNFASKDQLEAMNQRVRLLEGSGDRQTGNKAGVGMIIGIGFSLVAVVGIVVNLVLNLT